ncbi:MAG: host attachment protein [Myxococcales bacterium]|nr:host attachment protein [Myxococcales bacterium]MCB9651663.1 host attachment protein [Deltaproteobacteria bacterium]
MERYCILVADGTRARFFVYKERVWEWGEPRPRLTEQADLVNPEHALAGVDVYREARSSAHPANSSGHHTAYDDHRDDNRREGRRRFARRVVDRLGEVAKGARAEHLVVCAGPELMGVLRPELDRGLHPRLRVEEVTRDWTQLSTEDLQGHLVREGILRDPGPPPDQLSA